MNKRVPFLFFTILALILLQFQAVNSIPAPDFYCKKKTDGDPTIDGVIGSAEYGETPSMYTIDLNDSSGGMRTADLYLVHNSSDVFIGFIIADKTEADPGNNEMDWLLIFFYVWNGTHNFVDWKLSGNLQQAGVSYLDFHDPLGAYSPTGDENQGGTTDGIGAWTYNSGVYTIEMSFPLDSADDNFDINYTEGSMVSLWNVGIEYVNDSTFGSSWEVYTLNATWDWYIEFSDTLTVIPEFHPLWFSLPLSAALILPIILYWRKRASELLD